MIIWRDTTARVQRRNVGRGRLWQQLVGDGQSGFVRSGGPPASGLCEEPFGHPEDRRSVAHGASPCELAESSLKKLEPVRGEQALILRRLLRELRSQACTLAKFKLPRVARHL